MSKAPLLNISNLQIALPGNADRPYAVDGVDLQLRHNEILCVVGESGSGMSLMARAVMGLLPAPYVHASGGTIHFEDEDLLKLSDERMRDVRGSQISMIFQEPMTALNPVMTIGAQISEVLKVHTAMNSSARRERVLEILANVHLPDPRSIYSAFPHQLSGGQRQRAMISMSLVLSPKIIIADEPTTALDVTTQAQILLLIREIQEKRASGVLFITHDFGVVAEIGDRIAVMQKGNLIEFGDAEQILNDPQQDYTKKLINAVPGLTVPPRATKLDDDIILETIGLEKTFKIGGGFFGKPKREVHAARNINISLHRGETLGVVGESGSGKSTLARLIIRLIDNDDGEILLNNTNIANIPSREMRSHRKHIQMIFQDPFASLNPRYKVGRIIAEGPMIHGASLDNANTRARELLELVGLDGRAADRYPHEFSGGQRQRIGIARALALDPEILIADEAVSALDVSVQEQILELLAKIREKFGLSMLFITHDLCVAAQICDRIAVMRRGQVVEYGETAEIFSNPQHDYTTALFASIPGREWVSAKSSI